VLKINNIQYLLKTNLKFVNIYTIFMPFCVTGVQIACFFMILGSLISCADWSTENDRVVARVGDVYLYSSDFEERIR
jgi:hypothetical protein